MTKSELVINLSAKFKYLGATDSELIVKTILNEMTKSLCRGNRIEIRGFGSFGLNLRPSRIGRNPKSGERVTVPPKYVPHFKAGKELRKRVDKWNLYWSSHRYFLTNLQIKKMEITKIRIVKGLNISSPQMFE